jgi:hypothetical protein
MISPLALDDITLLREALAALRTLDGHAINLAARASQSGAQARQLTVLGGRGRHMDALDRRLRDAHAHLTGAPVIQHGNADLTTESTTFPPLTRAEEAQEASRRG